MKKQFVLAGLLVVGFASAQQGKVGVNTQSPQATLDVQPTSANLINGTTNEGIIAPKLPKTRVAAITTPVEGTLVYVDNITYAGNNAKVTKIDATGYYFYNGAEWAKVVSGNITTTGSAIQVTNGLTKSGETVKIGGALTEATTITQGSNTVTFNGETASKVTFNTTTEHMGGHYVKVTKVVNTTYNVIDTDYMITIDGPTDEVKIQLPSPANAKGRVLIFTNKTSQSVALQVGGVQAISGSGQPNIPKDQAMTIACDGTRWFGLINF